MTTADKVLENRLRRKLGRMGYMMQKSRAKDPDGVTFGMYRIVAIDGNYVVAGEGPFGPSLDLDEVAQWISEARG